MHNMAKFITPSCHVSCGPKGKPQGCMFHSILNDNNPRIAHKLRCILADFVREQWEFQLPDLGMIVGELIGGSGLSKEGYLKNNVQSSYWGNEI